jgi:hypothetical protein
VEALVQMVKSVVKYRNTQKPEVVVVNWLLMLRALATARAQHPQLQSYEEAIPSTLLMHGSNLDHSEGSQLLGAGRQLPCNHNARLGPSAGAARAMLLQYVDVFTPAGWSQQLASAASLLCYSHAHVITHAESLIVQSRLYSRATKRVSQYVLCKFLVGEETRCYIGEILYFLRCNSADAGILRLAVADLYPAELQVQAAGGQLWRAYTDVSRGVPRNRGLEIHRSYPVGLHDILAKVAPAGSKGDVHFYMPYAMCSNLA